ncbi:MAG: CPBP family intramembrane metalloprotease [Planctomycetaceae bacterium]|nr:CPBP family intramembrane metalloprotease [Planctomycetaceae bacterium]
MSSPEPHHRLSRPEAVLVAIAITLAFVAIPEWLSGVTGRWCTRAFQRLFATDSGNEFWGFLYHFWALCLGLLLVGGSPRKYGLCRGNLRPHRGRVMAMIGLPLTVATIGCQFIPLPEWMGQNMALWMISPLAQDLVFGGFIYVLIESVFPGDLHQRLPIRRTVVISGIFFSLHHLPNVLYSPVWFVLLQLCYTYLGYLMMGLVRQWTGSLLYVTFTHSLGNLIGWWFARG